MKEKGERILEDKNEEKKVNDIEIWNGEENLQDL